MQVMAVVMVVSPHLQLSYGRNMGKTDIHFQPGRPPQNRTIARILFDRHCKATYLALQSTDIQAFISHPRPDLRSQSVGDRVPVHLYLIVALVQSELISQAGECRYILSYASSFRFLRCHRRL
jgi:hypothetical protein